MSLKRIRYFFNLYKWTFAVGTIFVICANIASSYTNKLVEGLINDLEIVLLADIIQVSTVRSVVFEFLLMFLGLTLLSALFTYLMRQTIIVASRKIERILKDDLYDHIQNLDISHFKKYPIGDFMNRMAEDVEKIRELFGPAVMYLVNMVTVLTVSIFFMLQISRELTLYALIPLPLLSFFIYFFNIYSLRFNKKLQEEMSSMTSLAQESYNGIRIIKSFTLENKVFQSFTDLSLSFKKLSLKIVKLQSFFLPTISLLMGASILLSIYKGGVLKMDGKITIGGLTAFIMFVNRLLWPVMSIGWIASLYQKAKAAMIRYSEIMELPKELDVVSQSPDGKISHSGIEFHNVSYTYSETGIKAIDNVSFTIQPGERWLIIGKTGCGKSTLAELLMKFYSDYSGQILVGGEDIQVLSSKELREHISYIPQDVFLFSDTVRNNININNYAQDDKRILNAAKDAQIHEEITQFKEGYHTVVGERGITLSGGQKQRISIARALLKESLIYLFDDCLSAVDVETERKLIDAMNKKSQGSTIILITHRVFNQLNFDKVMVLHEGRVVEIGSHDELLGRKGYYFNIYKKQEMSLENK